MADYYFVLKASVVRWLNFSVRVPVELVVCICDLERFENVYSYFIGCIVGNELQNGSY